MGKIIKKTVIITLACMLLAMLSGAGACMVFFPSAASDFSYDVGMYKASVFFAKASFEKTGSDGDLKRLVERAIIVADDEAVICYAPKYLECGSFSAFAKEEDAHATDMRKGDYLGYIAGHLAVSEYLTGNKTKALDTAGKYTAGYGDFNPFRYLIFAVTGKGDRAFAKTLRERLSAITASEEQLGLLNSDMEMLNRFIGE